MGATVPPVAASGPSGAEPGRRRGRPPRISRAQIADAAIEIGLAELTLKAVADHLGVTVAALYHHVDGRDDLMRLAADRSAIRLVVPEDTGQHWTAWLLEWGEYNRRVFVADPALFEHFVDGAISPEVIARGTEDVLAVLVRQGFTVEGAHQAFELVTGCAVGLAVASIRERRSAERGDPTPTEQLRRATSEDAADLPLTAALVRNRSSSPAERAPGLLRSVVVGLALQRGEDPHEVADALDATVLGSS